MQSTEQTNLKSPEKEQQGYSGEPEKAKITVNDGGKENPDTDM